jgi:ribonucleoside-diphosphate reductase alpha chain
MSARAMIEREPAYSQAAARLLLDIMRREALGFLDMAVGVETQADMGERYADYFAAYIKRAAATWNCWTSSSAASTSPASAPRCARARPAVHLPGPADPLRPLLHPHRRGIRFELPQAFFMRVAMGLAINEIDREERAIEFYELLSSSTS